MELFGGILAEEYRRCLHGGIIGFGAVYHSGDFFGKALLDGAKSGVGSLLLDELLYLFAGEFGEYLYVALGVGVAYIEPELVELVG